MSRLEKLIRELCPDEVEIVELSTIAHYAKVRIDASQVDANNYVGVENLLPNKQGKVYASSVPKSGSVIAFNPGDILIGNIRPYLRKIWLADCSGGTNGDVLTVQINNSRIMTPKFLYYVLSSERFFVFDIQNSKGAKMPRGSKDAVMRFEVPVPPLEVQQEIVRILDTFTTLTAELQAKLEDELQARKKQFEYYRDQLLTFDSNIQYKKMGELFPLIRNGFVGTITPYFTDEEHGVRYLEGRNIHNGVISDNEVLYVTRQFHQDHIKNELKPDDILMVQSGHIGECAVVGEKYAGANCHALIIMSSGGQCNSKYVCHYFHSHHGFRSLAPAMTGGTVKHVLATKMKEIKIPVPSRLVQDRIVNILDNYEAICSELKIGLTAEIEARQKQYEYYRDKLLDFDRM